MIETVTVNQWHIKSNATEGTHLPPICINRYEYVRPLMIDGEMVRDWGVKVGETRHRFAYDVPAGRMVYDPVNKTPCGASCWMEYEV